MTSFCANENSKLCNDCGHWAECPECGVCGLCRLYDPPSEQRTYCLKHYRQTFPGKGCDMCEMEARIEALEKDFAYHSELCTIQQARIDELEAAAERYSDNGHFPDCAVNDWTTADCNCGLAELEALLPGGGE